MDCLYWHILIMFYSDILSKLAKRCFSSFSLHMHIKSNQIIKRALSTTISYHLYCCLFHRSKCRCHFRQSSYCNTNQLRSLCDKSSCHLYPNNEPLFKVTYIFSSCLLDPKSESTGPTQHFHRCHRSLLDINCSLIPSCTPVWKHVYLLCFSTYLFRLLLSFNLSPIYTMKCKWCTKHWSTDLFTLA